MLWQHEALDFTPWLARNLHLLGKELGIELELVQREKPVGSLYLDILAREVGTDVLVAIENQLEWTDISHLGQLLTYATKSVMHMIAIWVSPEYQVDVPRQSLTDEAGQAQRLDQQAYHAISRSTGSQGRLRLSEAS